MTTTDSNGIAYLEQTDGITPFHTLINGLQTATSTALGNFKGRLPPYTSGTRPAGVLGLMILETDTGNVMYYNGSDWESLSGTTRSVPLTSVTTAAAAETNTGLTVSVKTTPGAVYAVTFTGRIAGTVADLRAGVRIRRGTGTGDTLVGEALIMPAVANTGQTCEYTIYDTAVASTTVWTAFTVTLGGSGNTSVQASASAPATLAVRKA